MPGPSPDLSRLRRVASTVIAPAGERYDLALQIRRRGPRALRGGDAGIAVEWTRVRDGVRIDVLALTTPSDADLASAIDAAAGLAGLHDDPGDFGRLAAAHPVVAALHDRYVGARLTRTPTVFDAFAVAVVEQLVTWSEAAATLRRIAWRWGEPIPGTPLRAPPTAATLAAVPPWALRECGLGLRRATTLLTGARLASRIEALRAYGPEEAMRRLRSIRGVGVWTANKVALAAFGYADACLEGDAGAPFVTTMALTGRAGDDAAMLACLAPFRPHRARVHRLFELAERHGGGVPGVPPRRVPRVDPHRREPWRTG